MRNLCKLTLLFSGLAAGVLTAQAQPGAGATPPLPGGAPSGAAPKSGPKPYKEVITDKAKTMKGLFHVHKLDDKYFFEIGDSVMNSDILVVTRMSKAPSDIRIGGFLGYAGDDLNESVVRFERGQGNKIFLRKMSYTEYVKDSTKPMYKNVQRSNVQPIVGAFDVKAWSKDSMGAVIDVTDYINGDNDVLFFANSRKTILRVGGLQPDKSYIVGVRTYPLNTEITTVKTYSKSGGAPSPFLPAAAPAAGGNLTFELNTSMLILPKKPMQPRYYDNRVAYFTTRFTDFDADPQGVKNVDMVTRWRLEVKDADMEKFKRGELVEPKKPIVFYIDPTTPEKWVPFLMQGVDDWQKAFEKAGFKNAIMAKRAPSKAEDSTWTLEDARYSAIVYKPSDIANASGPHVHDPRSGEILESHINWYHNVMRLLRNWYLIQASPSDPKARKAKFDDALMGQLIRFVSSHEVGHTLGLPHNMGSSSATPVEKLRDKAWVEANGHTSSIMDYARFNYVAQPGDNIGQVGLFPRIGDYDLWSIEWGYRPVPGKTEDEEKQVLNTWVKSKYNTPNLRFIFQDGVDPRAQTESVGDDNVKASEYGVKNLKWILPQLPGWLNQEGEIFTDLNEVYGEVISQFQRYIGHVLTNIGGIYTDLKTTEQEGKVYSLVQKDKQKAAFTFIQKQVLETPMWLLNKDILDKISSPATDRISQLQDGVLNGLLSQSRLMRLVMGPVRDDNAYRIDEYMDDVKKAVWTELAAGRTIDYFRRNLQKSFVDRMGALINPPSSGGSAIPGLVFSVGPDASKTDLLSVAKGVMRSLRAEVAAAVGRTADKMSKYHLQDMLERINDILNPKN